MKDAGIVRPPLHRIKITHELHDEIEFVGCLKGISEANQERVVDVLQDHLLCFGVLDLIFLDDVVLDDGLHCKELFGILLFD